MSVLRVSLLLTGIIMFLLGLSMHSYAKGKSTCDIDAGMNWTNIGGIAFITTGLILLVTYVIIPFLPTVKPYTDSSTDLSIPTLGDLDTV